MATQVRRTLLERSRRDGATSLRQSFVFTGDRATATAITDVLLHAPLVGDRSIFGARPGTEVESDGDDRSLRGFSPAPGFRFDVDLTPTEAGLIVRFSQPDRRTPYLEGALLWVVTDREAGAVLGEHVNTELAQEAVDEPLGGARPSLRRWLFFRAGHPRVMLGAARNVATLLDAR